jgi:hypothetical protein
LTISIFQRPVAATVRAIFGPWYPASGKILVMFGKRRRARCGRLYAIAILYVGRQGAHTEREPDRFMLDSLHQMPGLNI